MPARRPKTCAQAWVSLRADDPEAVSALAVARAHLPGGAALEDLRRYRLFELKGGLPAVPEVEELLHRSTQFYNPHKERCVVRTEATAPSPVTAGEHAIVVSERDGERRPAAERWWRHETGARIEVREATAWVMRFARDADGAARADDLAAVRDREHGLLCNPNAQDLGIAGGSVPLPWIGVAKPRRRTRRTA